MGWEFLGSDPPYTENLIKICPQLFQWHIITDRRTDRQTNRQIDRGRDCLNRITAASLIEITINVSSS